MVARALFESELEKLNCDLIKMSAQVEDMLEKAISAYVERDEETAREVAKRDDKIDDMESGIEKRCLSLIARQQPLAKDLRMISSSLKIITDLERIADHAVDIAEIILMPGDYLKPTPGIMTMVTETKRMFHSAIDAYVARDCGLAIQICQDDDIVDNLFESNILELINLCKVEPGKVGGAINLIFVIRYLERVADHATNICEWVVYNETGTHRKLQNL